MSRSEREFLELAQRCKEAEDKADFFRGFVEKMAEIATDEEADAWDKSADDFPGYIDFFSVILSARRALKEGEKPSGVWKCPIKKVGCMANCGNYGCGN